MTPELLARIWTEIESSPMPRDRGWVRRLTNPQAPVPVYAAVACAGGMRSLMVDIPISTLGVLQELPVTGGLIVRLESPLDGVPSDQRTLLLELEDHQYFDIFEIFCAHLIDGMSKCARAGDATTLLLGRLARWQDFLRLSHDHLGQQAVIGLFGELWCLRDLLIPHAGLNAIGAWKGAQKAPQDFIFAGLCAVEVKTSKTRPMGSVTIHGEQQLDDAGLPCLFLACLRLELDDAGESLNDIVASLRRLAAAAPEFAAGFEIQLVEAGWLQRHAPLYESTRFRVAQERFFRVSGEFPRLLPDSLSLGVDDVHYRLELKACTRYEQSRVDVENEFASLNLKSRLLT